MAKVQTTSAGVTIPARQRVRPAAADSAHWREALPILSSASATLREPVDSDARSLLTALPDDALVQIVADPPPVSVAGIEHLIQTLQGQRRAGLMACWAVVPADIDAPVGLIGVRAMDHACSMVEGFGVIAEEFRGTSLFQSAGRLLLSGLFGQMGVHRAEFRIDVRNGRANGAMRKLGATHEGLLRRARAQDGQLLDQVLWAIIATDWSDFGVTRTSSVH